MEVTLRTEIDTAHPQQQVPIYLIHSIARPFCTNPHCWCQTNKEQILPLLRAITNGEMTVCEAASVATDNAE